MTRNRSILLGVVVVATLALAAGAYWFGPQHLFLDQRVDEAVPTASDRGRPSGQTDGEVGSAGQDDPAPPGPATLAEGSFRSLEHQTSGSVSVIELGDGSRLLRFEGLDTLGGPDLRVYLSEAPAAGPPEALDDAFIDLGGLKGNQGNQNYEIPSGVSLDDVESVSTWCRRFSVGFGVAPLTYDS